MRAFQYAHETAPGVQKNKTAAKTPFIVGAIIELGKCLNLVEAASLKILEEAYYGLKGAKDAVGQQMPVNRGNNRVLDCDVL